MFSVHQETHYKNAILENNFEWFYYHTPPEEITLHEHDFHEIYLFLSGNIQYLAGGREFPLLPGDIVVVPAGSLHTPVFLGSEAYERIVLWVKSEYVNAISTPQTDLSQVFSVPDYFILHAGSAEAQKLRTSFLENDGEGYGADIRMVLTVWHLLLYLNENYTSVTVHRKHRNRYEELIDYIRRHPKEDLSLETLAKKCNLSKYHLLRDFKLNYGITLHQYIVKERLVDAKRMLLEGISVLEVSTECGFTDYSGFLAAFKKEYHITPTAFCRLMKEN